jgi:tetrahydromethanopterin S-methyltransferase subunit C
MKKRPIGITLLAVLAALAAIMAIIHTLQMLNLLPFFLGPVKFFGGLNIFGAIMWGMLAAIYFWLVKMLWNVEPQGWLFLVMLSALNLIMAVVSIIGHSSLQAMLPSILINGLILIYCILPGTKDAFGVD